MLKKIPALPFVFFSLTTLIVLWPLALCLFTVKNDALTYYYPVRALISDALNNGELPLWTPFINFGYPLHADMQSGAWSPVVWIFSYLTHFSLAGFHAELLFYFIMAGVGFYYLCRQYQYTIITSLVFGLAYQLSGFMIDSVQFYACIGSACWLPFIFLFYKRIMKQKKIIDGLLTGFFLYLAFTGGYPSLFIVMCYLLLSHFIFIFFTDPEKKIFIKRIAPSLIATSIVFVLLSLPAIFSFARHLSYIDRGKTQALSFVLENSMPPAAMLSFVSPFSTTAASNWLVTDPLMRNIYIGIIPLLFVGYGIVSRQVTIKADVRFFLATAIIMFAMALGSYFFLRQAAYYVLPLMNTFRHPAVIRLFGIFSLLLFAAHAFNSWQANYTTANKKIVRKLVLIALLVIISFGIVAALKHPDQVKQLSSLIQSGNLKSLFQSASFTERYWIQLPFIIVTLAVIILSLKRRKVFYLLPFVMLLDIFTASQFNIPVTVIGATRFDEVEKTINRNAVTFPIPPISVSVNDNSKESYSSTTGSTLHYTKKIGRNDYYITPGNLSLQEKFYESAWRKKVFEKPVLFFDNDSAGNIVIHSLGANYIELTAVNDKPSTLIYLQNNYPGWTALVDNNNLPIETAYETFISVKLTPGKHTIILQYRSAVIYIAWYISMVSLAVFLFLLLRTFFFKKQHQ